jgi:beta-glucosidase
MSEFPSDLVWGAATARVPDRGPPSAEDGRGESIWDRFCATPARSGTGTAGRSPATSTTASPGLRADAELGLDSFRFSVAWPRVLPGRTRAHQRGGPRLLRTGSSTRSSQRDRAVRDALPLGHAAGARGRGGWPARATARRSSSTSRRSPAARRPRRALDHAQRAVGRAWVGYGWGSHAPGRTSEPTRSPRRTTCCSRTAGRSSAAARVAAAAGRDHARPPARLPASDDPGDAAQLRYVDGCTTAGSSTRSSAARTRRHARARRRRAPVADGDLERFARRSTSSA